MKSRHTSDGRAFSGASIEGGKGRIYGYLGEEIPIAQLNGAIRKNTKDYDFVYKGYTFEVKTKVRKDVKMWYDASVDQSSSHQRPDFYIFVAVIGPRNFHRKSEDFIIDYNYEDSYIMGFIGRDKFFKKARSFNAGDIDPSNGIKYRDGINLVKYQDLIDFNQIKNLKGKNNG